MLSALPPNEYERMLPNLEEVEMTYDTKLLDPGDKIRNVYFPNSGMIALLAAVEEDSTLIACVVGREGMSGLPLFLGAKKAAVRAVVQGEGTAMRMSAPNFEIECQRNGALPRLLLRFTHSILVQILQSAVCCRFHPVEKRLARWILMTGDRMDSDEFQMTQNALSNMVGARREAVTRAAGLLRTMDLISYSRGNIQINNRPGLEAAACNCYTTIRDEEKK
jgi:CRP-like cAMP-binding protein